MKEPSFKNWLHFFFVFLLTWDVSGVGERTVGEPATSVGSEIEAIAFHEENLGFGRLRRHEIPGPKLPLLLRTDLKKSAT